MVLWVSRVLLETSVLFKTCRASHNRAVGNSDTFCMLLTSMLYQVDGSKENNARVYMPMHFFRLESDCIIVSKYWSNVWQDSTQTRIVRETQCHTQFALALLADCLSLTNVYSIEQQLKCKRMLLHGLHCIQVLHSNVCFNLPFKVNDQ